MNELQKIYVPDTMRMHTVAGKMHSGKDTAAGMVCDVYRLQGLTAEFRSTSSYLKSFAETDEGRWNLGHIAHPELLYEADGKTLSRYGLRELGYLLQNEFGGDVLVRRLVGSAVEDHRNGLLDVFTLNGIRRIAEAETIIRSGLGLWWVEASLDVRSGYSIRDGEVKTVEEFRKKNIPEDFETDIIKSMRTKTITNEGSLDEMHIQIVGLINEGEK